MPRLALLTTECAQVGETFAELLRRHGRDVALVVTSDVYRPSRGGMLRQTVQNLRRSGPGFVWYLLCSFVGYRALISLDRARSRVTGRPRRRLSIADLCRQAGVRHLHTRDVNGPDVIEALGAEQVDLVVVYWFDQILHEEFIGTPPAGVLNVHAAYLPHCRGLFPVLFTAYEAGPPYGISVHRIDNREIDAGPLLDQLAVRPPAGRSVLFRDAYVNRSGVDLLEKVLVNLAGHQATPMDLTDGSYHSYPDRAQVRRLRRAGVPLATVRDLLAVTYGSVADRR